MSSLQPLEIPSKRKIYSLESINFSKNQDFVNHYRGKVADINAKQTISNPIHDLEKDSPTDVYIEHNIEKLLKDITNVSWLPEPKHAEAFTNMLVDEIHLCLAGGLYVVCKKLRHPSLIARIFFVIKDARNHALEISKLRFKEYQNETHFSVEANVERTLVVFRKQLRKLLHAKQLVNNALKGTSLPSLSFNDANLFSLKEDLNDISNAIPYETLVKKTAELKASLPEIVQRINTKTQIRLEVLQEFGKYDQYKTLAPKAPTSSLVNYFEAPVSFTHPGSLFPSLFSASSKSDCKITLDAEETHQLECSQARISQSKAKDHPLIEASITRQFSRFHAPLSSPPFTRYLSKTHRRPTPMISTEHLNELVNTIEKNQTNGTQSISEPIAGIGLAKFHHKPSQSDIGFNLWDLVHWLIDDDVEGGYGPDTDYNVARSQEVEELFEEILRTNPQNHIILTEPIQADQYPCIPASSMSAKLMHPMMIPRMESKESLIPKKLTETVHIKGRIQKSTRVGHTVHVHADAFHQDRAHAMDMVPSSKSSHSRYNYGGYIPELQLKVLHQELNATEYRTFVQRFPNDFLTTTVPRVVSSEGLNESEAKEIMTSNLPTFVHGYWQPSTLETMDFTFAERFQRVIRRLSLSSDLALVYANATEEIQHQAVRQWEEIARCILKREQLLHTWIHYEVEHVHPFRFWKESSVNRMQEAKERDVFLHQLQRYEEQVKKAIHGLKTIPHGKEVPVMYQGRDYLEKMAHDKSELLHQLLKQADRTK